MRTASIRQKNDRKRAFLSRHRERHALGSAFWYTVLYALLFGFILYFFAAEHRSLVYHADAWRQHLRAYAYYGKWLRGCAWNLLHGQGVSLQNWSFGLGYGADVLTTLQYYCFGEPLAFLNILVPERFCKLYFEFLIVLRPYLAGLAFMAYVRYVFPDMRRIPLLAGALSYSFCGTVLYLGMLHPFFVTPMIYFPLLLLGVERVLQERRPLVFMLSVWMAGISNFYFFYMLALLTAGYGVCRVGFRAYAVRRQARSNEAGSTSDKETPGKRKHRGDAKTNTAWRADRRNARSEWKQAVAELFRLLGYAVIGTMAAGAILIPVLVQFQSDPRGATEFSLSLFYEPTYYQELLKNLVTFINHPLYDTELCMSLFVAAALMVLLGRKGHRQLKVAVLGCIALLCFPVAGYLLNGASYVINRWTFAAEFLLALVLAVVWNECISLRTRQSATGSGDTLALVGQSAGGCGKGRPSRENGKDSKWAAYSGWENVWYHLEQVAFVGLLACIAGNIYLGYARIPADENGEGGQSGYASEFTDAQTPAEYMQAAYRNEAAVIQNYESSASNATGSGISGNGDEAAGSEVEVTNENPGSEGGTLTGSFLRYSGRDLTYNAGAQLGRSSTQFFWSFANGAVADFFQALGVNEEQNFCYTGLDDRAALEALAGVQYYSIAYDNSFEQKFVPYGFSDIGTVAGESGVPENVRQELTDAAEQRAAKELASNTEQSESSSRKQNAEQGAQQNTALAADGTIPEASGAVLGDDSWEPVRPEYHLYSSMFALPLGYTYTGVLSQEDFAAMTPTQRQEAIVQGVLLGDADAATDGANLEVAAGNIASNEEYGAAGNEEENISNNAALQNVIQPEYYEQELPYTAEASDGITITQEEDGGTAFIVTNPEATVTLTFTGTENAETYLLLQDLEITTLHDGADTLQEIYPITVSIFRQGETLIDKTINYKTPINQYYSGWKDFALNMGYNTGAPDTITIRFQYAGCYTVSGLAVIGQPMETLMTTSVERAVCTLQNVDLHQNPISLATNEITGALNAEQDRILVFNIPYSTGWTAYDNGEKVELQKANLMYLAMPAAAGSHEIRLVYHTPGGRVGGVVSAIGILLMLVMWKRVKFNFGAGGIYS